MLAQKQHDVRSTAVLTSKEVVVLRNWARCCFGQGAALDGQGAVCVLKMPW